MSSDGDARWVDATVETPDGVRIAYRDYDGAGPDVVMMPGIGGNLEALHQTALLLRGRWRIVCVEPRGIGQSGESESIDSADLVVDVETVVGALGLRLAALVGYSLGGVVAGHYATVHPVPLVSVDGFAAGVTRVGTTEQRAAVKEFMHQARLGLSAMTAEPHEGDDQWRLQQIQVIHSSLDAMGYRAAHRSAMVARQFVLLPNGRWRRQPSAKLVATAERDAFGDPPANVVGMFRTCTAPVLILRCTHSDWPDVLDAELDDLAATHPGINVRRLPLTHTGPVTDGVHLTVAEISTFLTSQVPNPPGTQQRL